MSAVSTDLDLLIAAHLECCQVCMGEPLFIQIRAAATAPGAAAMGRAVLIAHLHPEDEDPDGDGVLACLKQAVADDIAAKNSGDPTDTWIVFNQAGDELARVGGVTYDMARDAAEQIPAVRASARREGAYGLRRLGEYELRPHQQDGQEQAS